MCRCRSVLILWSEFREGTYTQLRMCGVVLLQAYRYRLQHAYLDLTWEESSMGRGHVLRMIVFFKVSESGRLSGQQLAN
jgi:hypothetical protein